MTRSISQIQLIAEQKYIGKRYRDRERNQYSILIGTRCLCARLRALRLIVVPSCHCQWPVFQLLERSKSEYDLCEFVYVIQPTYGSLPASRCRMQCYDFSVFLFVLLFKASMYTIEIGRDLRLACVCYLLWITQSEWIFLLLPMNWCCTQFQLTTSIRQSPANKKFVVQHSQVQTAHSPKCKNDNHIGDTWAIDGNVVSTVCGAWQLHWKSLTRLYPPLAHCRWTAACSTKSNAHRVSNSRILLSTIALAWDYSAGKPCRRLSTSTDVLNH